ncbi:hypothetical protein KY290_000970 [Solanum tuberosum]|uniref:Uncharacterized protein n=1 Tax=Solanum tuberosum TaxID=4113 RepID=A0ABQ7WKT2_SOLTU|nr:hypothetical protein KY289_001067 [Solanum tuberosum]KAH0765014.1 hypothetical protein KY285_000885 [Solanum tuberosum]KAH0781372.1 hypothetical protein KY290_000970 [Solanum tuberosum]
MRGGNGNRKRGNRLRDEEVQQGEVATARRAIGQLEKDWKAMSKNVGKAREGLSGWSFLGEETLPIRG